MRINLQRWGRSGPGTQGTAGGPGAALPSRSLQASAPDPLGKEPDVGTAGDGAAREPTESDSRSLKLLPAVMGPAHLLKE